MANEQGRYGTTTQAVAFTSVSVAGTSVGPQTYRLRLATNAPCFVAIGDGAQTATSTKVYLPAGAVEYVTVTPGQSIAATRGFGGVATSADGTLYVTELG